MTDLVFIDPAKLDATPFTTSEVIAEFAGVQHHTVTRLIQSHVTDFEEFGILRFEIEEITGRGQPKKNYRLNEEQATLLMTYLKNTEQVREFKKRLVRAFFLMRKELTQRQINRAKMLPPRHDLTDAIRDYIPDSPHKSMWYKHYTDLAYQAVTGMTAAKLRQARNAPKGAVAADYMTAGEMAAVAGVSGKIAVLVELGMEYQQIKRLLLDRQRLSA